MNNKEYLNEAKYQKTSKNLFYIGIGIIALGIVVAIIIVVANLIGNNKPNKEELQQQLNELKTKLESRYDELESKGVVTSSNYRDKEGYEMYLIDKTLSPTFDICFNDSKNSDNDTIKEYCNVEDKIHDLNNSSGNRSTIFEIFPAFMLLIPCIGFGAMFIMMAKRREIAAFQAQQIMPIAQEGIEKMSPTLGKAAGTIAKDIKNELKEEDKK